MPRQACRALISPGRDGSCMARKKNGRTLHKVRVKKRHVDPVDAKRQAEDLARRHADVPMGANTRELEFEARDNGDHYEVSIRESPSRGSGPPSGRPGRGSGGLGYGGGVGLGVGGGHDRSPGMPDHAEGDEFVPALSLSGPSQARTTDLVGRLQKDNSIAELRRLSKRYGVSLKSTDSKRRIAEKLATQAPAGARREAGLR